MGHFVIGRGPADCDRWSLCFRFGGLTLCRAHEVVLEQRPFIRPNAGFWRQLVDYERTLFGRTTVRMVKTPSGVLPEALQDSAAAYCINV